MVQDWVKEITEQHFGGTPFDVGDTVKHPDGRTVEITEGQYWGAYGLSNFWYWREVMYDGSLSKKEEHGYGWRTKITGTSYVKKRNNLHLKLFMLYYSFPSTLLKYKTPPTRIRGCEVCRLTHSLLGIK